MQRSFLFNRSGKRGGKPLAFGKNNYKSEAALIFKLHCTQYDVGGMRAVSAVPAIVRLTTAVEICRTLGPIKWENVMNTSSFPI